MPKLIANQFDEALTILAEECGELVQVISKIRRFGIEDTTVKNKQEWLEQECGDVLALIQILVEKGYINQTTIDRAVDSKKQKLTVYSSLYDLT